MDKKKRLSQDLTSKKVCLESSESSPKKIPLRVKSDGLGEDDSSAQQKGKSRGSTLSPKLPHSSPTAMTPVGSPQSSRSGSVDHGKNERNSTSRPGTPTVPNLPINRASSPAPIDSNGAEGFENKEAQSGVKSSKPDSSSKDNAEAEEEEEENDEQISNEEYKLQVKNSGRTNEELRSLIEAFSSDQLRRYEVFRRSSLNKANTRVLLSSILSQQATQNLAMIVAGFSKVFIGEIVEIALDVKKEWEEKARLSEPSEDTPLPTNTPLQPHHLREAYRRYRKQSNMLSGPRGPIAPATSSLHSGVPSIVSRHRRFFRH
ncbi:transcription initiation factor TFIID subunit 11 [Entomophthora muscae]|uniref:Transcription initiation factor TFIID subunit 11 n=1 Tax=Entomophthora muscae TaxID=34485 RepID=A0ACC2TFG9_9FUNG|nr:transcription initiation factor TFIID subunit 11 [Entomophthora muscae]